MFFILKLADCLTLPVGEDFGPVSFFGLLLPDVNEFIGCSSCFLRSSIIIVGRSCYLLALLTSESFVLRRPGFEEETPTALRL